MGKITEISTLGSCSSRNIFNSTVNKYYKDFFKINYSIEAVSLISLMSAPIEFDEKLINSSHEYDNYCARNDLSKEFLEFIKEDYVDYIILDTLFDVSPGVIEYDENRYISDGRLRNTDFYKTLKNTEPITPYTDFKRYFKLWTEACDKFFNFVETNCKKTKIILNCSRSVDKYIDKNGCILRDKNFENLANKYNPYRDLFDKYILENFDVEVLPFDMQTCAYENHIFGLHHTHFEPKFYLEKNNQLLEIINRNDALKFDNEQNKKIRKLKRDAVIKSFNKNMQTDFMHHLMKYGTARIDIKNVGNVDNVIEVIECSDSSAKIDQPIWFKNVSGIGTVVESTKGVLDLEIKCLNSGVLTFWLRGMDYRDIHDNRFPVYIDFTTFELNNQRIFDGNKVVWHDNPYSFKKEVISGEIVKIHVTWLPFNNYTSEYFDAIEHKKQVDSLNERLFLREKQLNSIPQLSATSLGKSTLNGKLVYRNWLDLKNNHSVMNDFNGFCENIWFTNYLKHKFGDDDFKIYIYGVFNPHDNITYPTEGKKVLYSAEDLNYNFLEMKINFEKYALDYVDLAMGFDLINNPRYIRFPHWLMTQFPPNVDEEIIENVVNSWKSSCYEKSRNVAAIASHDFWGTRTLVDNDIKDIVNVDYAGNWKRNTSDLQNNFNNNKNEFLKQYRFNLCAENTLSDGYVTEKIFNAISCDCIPLYAGGGDYFEPKVINPKAVIRWDGDPVVCSNSKNKKQGYYGYDEYENVRWYADDNLNSDAVELFKNLLDDEKSYAEFKNQEIIKDSSTKFIIDKFKELEKHFERLVYS